MFFKILCVNKITFTVVLGNIFAIISHILIQTSEIHSWKVWAQKSRWFAKMCSSLKILLREFKTETSLEAEAVNSQYIHASSSSSKKFRFTSDMAHDHISLQLFIACNMELLQVFDSYSKSDDP